MVTTWPFVGREGELTAIVETTGIGLLVTGAPGVGKSRLLAEAAGLAPDEVTVLDARPGQGPSVPFGAFSHLLPVRVPVTDVALAVETILARGGSGRVLLVIDDVHLLDDDSAHLARALAGTGRVTLLASGVLPQPLSPLVLTSLPLAPLTDVQELLDGTVDEATAAHLAALSGGDLRYLHELVRAARATGVLDDGHWKDAPVPVPAPRPAEDTLTTRAEPLPAAPETVAAPGPTELGAWAEEPAGSLEEALARAALLASLGRAAEAETELGGAPRRPEDRARAALASKRAANLAYGLGRPEEADRVLAIALETVTTEESRQRLMVEKAFAALHRAASREALDLADDAAAITTAGPVTAARIHAVEAVAAALTGQSTAGLDKVRAGLQHIGAWSSQAPEVGALLEFARYSVWMSVGDLDAAGEEGAQEDPVARAAAQARVLRARGQVQAALREAWNGARLLSRGHSPFAGPCLGELAHAAALAGDLETARDALEAADKRALPTLRALWFPVALARPWYLVAQGAVGAAVHGLLDAAAAAEALELRPYALAALHDVVRLGAAGVVADRLAQLAEDAEGDLAALCARHADAAAAGDWSGLIGASFEFEELGMALHAAEAAAQAAEVHWDKQQAAAAGTRAWVLVQRCDQVRTPALRTAAVPDLSRVQYEIAELVAAGSSELDIAERLQMPSRTVAEQLVEICSKLGVSGPERLAVLLSPSV
ncbi:ATP-binding protein [Actinocorallia longicatena]|uniref:ATP-binding protein n=1 Tax=Actinocorallia longicatena TaxID=111803 RepID=UPI0031D330BC